MLKDKMQTALNKQLNAEIYSAYIYLSMSAYCESINMKGMAHWFRVQTQEEWGHAMKFYNYLIERGGKMTLTAIEAPATRWTSPLKMFEDAHKHECKITGLIYEILNMAIADGDHATNNFLQWFVKEQVEEELQVDTIVQQIKLVGDSSGGLFMLDHELGSRKAQ